jgi:hypothetical protein
MVRTGEENTCLEHMLRKAAEFYDAEARSVLFWEPNEEGKQGGF